MHFHRDLLAIADGYAKEVLAIGPNDVAVGTTPLAFTFGLGALVIFPLRVGAASVLLEEAIASRSHCRDQDLQGDARLRRADGLPAHPGAEAVGRRPRVAAARRVGGRGAPAKTFEAWSKRFPVPLLDGMGGTEMLHIFISNRVGDAVAGAAGRPVTGYDVKVVGDDMAEKPRGEVGRLAVRGPTGCRYLDDPRQRDFVRDGWNLTGDLFIQDEEGRFHFVARADDMIVSAGEPIAAPEVEEACWLTLGRRCRGRRHSRQGAR